MLIASTPEGVIAYQLCHRENKASYRALLSRIPAPIVVVTDGDKGALAAIRQYWPGTIIQRCLVHIQRNIRGVTTANPKTDQHKALRQLGINLTRITTPEQALAEKCREETRSHRAVALTGRQVDPVTTDGVNLGHSSSLATLMKGASWNTRRRLTSFPP